MTEMVDGARRVLDPQAVGSLDRPMGQIQLPITVRAKPAKKIVNVSISITHITHVCSPIYALSSCFTLARDTSARDFLFLFLFFFSFQSAHFMPKREERSKQRTTSSSSSYSRAPASPAAITVATTAHAPAHHDRSMLQRGSGRDMGGSPVDLYPLLKAVSARSLF